MQKCDCMSFHARLSGLPISWLGFGVRSGCCGRADICVGFLHVAFSSLTSISCTCGGCQQDAVFFPLSSLSLRNDPPGSDLPIVELLNMNQSSAETITKLSKSVGASQTPANGSRYKSADAQRRPSGESVSAGEGHAGGPLSHEPSLTSNAISLTKEI